jgi:hypothetical protein
MVLQTHRYSNPVASTFVDMLVASISGRLEPGSTLGPRQEISDLTRARPDRVPPALWWRRPPVQAAHPEKKDSAQIDDGENDAEKGPQIDAATSGTLSSARLRAQVRWSLLVTLARNPGLIAHRKPHPLRAALRAEQAAADEARDRAALLQLIKDEEARRG